MSNCAASLRPGGLLRKIDRHAPRHRFKNPFTMSRRRADPAAPEAAEAEPEYDVFVTGVFLVTLGGAYRDRTDDLKLAKLALSQLS